MPLNHVELARSKASTLTLAGKRTRLRLLSPEDLPLTLAWRNRDDVRRWFIHSEAVTPEQHFAWWQEYQKRNNDFVFIIEDKQTDKPVGQVSLYNIDLEKGEAEYGRLMIGEKEAQGKGLAKEATRLLLDWAFNALQLKRVYLQVFKDNEVAINIYLGCGFTMDSEVGNLYQMGLKAERYLNQK